MDLELQSQIAKTVEGEILYGDELPPEVVINNIFVARINQEERWQGPWRKFEENGESFYARAYRNRADGRIVDYKIRESTFLTHQ